MMPSASSQLMRSCFATALRLAWRSQSIASASNNAVKREPGSAHATRSWRIPWVGQFSRGTRPWTRVLNWQVSRWRQVRSW